tara:strand:+ start:541 stop:2322 length:1782 start_codon:yes stop_codon:yes gene_type:complete
MGFIDQVSELLRRSATGDDWFFTENRYALELVEWGGIFSSVFVLPMGPEQYTINRTYRQGVTPTLGGVVAEERGLLWIDINVAGTFGLEAKSGYDTTYAPESVITPDTKLSGPMWTKRMLKNVLDKYGEYKADPSIAQDVWLVWHDFKMDDHWIVVPENAAINRNTGRKMQYPYNLKFKTIGEASDVYLPDPESSLWDTFTDAIANVNAGLALVSSAIQEGSAILGEVRYFVATIDSIIDNLTTIVNSAQDFVDGVSDTISIGTAFINSTAQLMEAALELMEDATGLPSDVRHNYEQAMDGLHKMSSQSSAFGTSYNSVTGTIAQDEAGAASSTRSDSVSAAESAGAPQSSNDMVSSNARSTDQALIDAGAVPSGREFTSYSGLTDYRIRSGDTLQAIAARELGDGALWYDLAVINGLQYPYISGSGGPGIVTPGTIIAIPRTGGSAVIAKVSEGEDPLNDILGTDIRLKETPQSVPGRPSVTIAIDRRTSRDVATISGLSNLSQAVQLRTWTEVGSMPMAPNYGIMRAIGFGATDAFISALRVGVKRTIQADRRIERISRLVMVAEVDAVEFDVDVIPVGLSEAHTVSTSIV